MKADNSHRNYSPFGSYLAGTNRKTTETTYGYGFNGKRKDPEMYNVSGSSYDFDARLYNSRLCRWMSGDPKDFETPYYSPYQAFNLNPIIHIDPTGESGVATITKEATDKEPGTITVTALFYFYGSNQKLIETTGPDIVKMMEDSWNAANAQIEVDGKKYNVEFSFTYQQVDPNTGLTLTEKSVYQMSKGDNNIENPISANTSYENNFIRIEETNQTIEKLTNDVHSFMEHKEMDAGTNSGFWLWSEVKTKTVAHEIGHGFGIVKHTPFSADLVKKVGKLVTIQGIMIAQTDVKAAGFNPNNRVVTQEEVLKIFSKATWENGSANIGGVTNIIYNKDGSYMSEKQSKERPKE